MMLWHAMGIAGMVVVAVVVGGVGGASYNEPTWGFQSLLHVQYSLICDHDSLAVQPHNHVEWELPNGTMLLASRDRFMLSDGMRGSVTNMNLTIHDVQEIDSGVYICHVYNNVRKEVKHGHILRGLNLGGHKYDDRFEEYRDNLMVGGLAAVVLFVPLVTACFIYKFRFQTEEQKAEKRLARLELTRHQRHLEENGQGAQLSDVAVTVNKGEVNAAYDNARDDMNTRL